MRNNGPASHFAINYAIAKEVIIKATLHVIAEKTEIHTSTGLRREPCPAPDELFTFAN